MNTYAWEIYLNPFLLMNYAYSLKNTITKVVLRGDEKLIINRLAIAGGSYSEGLHNAIDSGAKAYLTELRHHHILEANSLGLVLLKAVILKPNILWCPILLSVYKKM